MVYNAEFSQFIKCTPEEKKASVFLLKEILNQSKKARTDGLLALSQDSEGINNLFLRECINLLGKGYEYTVIERILDIRLAVRGGSGAKLLEMTMIKEGILSIMRGDPQSLTEEVLLSFLGEDEFELYKTGRNTDYQAYVKELCTADKAARTPSGQWLLDAEDYEISFLLKAIDWESLIILLAEETDAVLCKVYTNLSNEAGKLFNERLTSSGSMKEPQMKNAELKFTAITSKIKAGKSASPV